MLVCCFKKAELEVDIDIGPLDIDIEDLQSSVALDIDIVDLESGVAHDEPLSARSNVQRHSGIGEGEGVGLEGSKQLEQIQTFKQHKKMQKAIHNRTPTIQFIICESIREAAINYFAAQECNGAHKS